jgi:hypothetical protein
MKTITLSLVLILSVSGIIGVRAENAPAVRNILSSQLPSRLLSPIKKNYSNYWITDLHKQVSNGKVSYYITLEDADQKINLSATPVTGWTRTSVIAKDLVSR